MLAIEYYPSLMREVCAERDIDVEREFKLLSSSDVMPTLRAREFKEQAGPASAAFFQLDSESKPVKVIEATCG